jgi:uncharacterized Zn finger protein
MQIPVVKCPKCKMDQELHKVLTAQSNQNVIYICPHCDYMVRNIETKKG